MPFRPFLRASFIAGFMFAAAAAPALAQTPGERTVETRLSVALRVPEAAVQAWLLPPWRVQPPTSGPSAGANLTLIFFDRMSVLNPDGTPMAGGIDRGLVLSVPATNPDTGESGSYVIRGYSANAATLPGAYGNYEFAEVRRVISSVASDLEFGHAADAWTIEPEGRGQVDVRVEYDRAMPARSAAEPRVRGGPNPAFYRIYRLDQGVDVVLSEATGVDRVERFELEVSVPDLEGLFDESEEVVSVTVTPWYMRDVFLP